MPGKDKVNTTEIEEDFLEVDTPIPGQNYTCLSFVSPEKELANKSVFQVHEFLKHIAPEYQLKEDEIKDKYEDFLYQERERLEKEFFTLNDFRTSVRGVKVRGCYESLREAQVRAKVLQRKDPSFHVFVGQVGYWLPWDPCADDVEDQEYTEGHLNKLVKKYKENQKKKDVFWDQQKAESLKKMEEDTQAKKKKLEEEAETEDKTTENSDTAPRSDFTDMDPWMKRKMEQEQKDTSTTTDNAEPNESVSDNTSKPVLTPDTDGVIDLDKEGV